MQLVGAIDSQASSLFQTKSGESQLVEGQLFANCLELGCTKTLEGEGTQATGKVTDEASEPSTFPERNRKSTVSGEPFVVAVDAPSMPDNLGATATKRSQSNSSEPTEQAAEVAQPTNNATDRQLDDPSSSVKSAVRDLPIAIRQAPNAEPALIESVATGTKNLNEKATSKLANVESELFLEQLPVRVVRSANAPETSDTSDISPEIQPLEPAEQVKAGDGSLTLDIRLKLNARLNPSAGSATHQLNEAPKPAAGRVWPPTSKLKQESYVPSTNPVNPAPSADVWVIDRKSLLLGSGFHETQSNLNKVDPGKFASIELDNQPPTNEMVFDHRTDDELQLADFKNEKIESVDQWLVENVVEAVEQYQAGKASDVWIAERPRNVKTTTEMDSLAVRFDSITAWQMESQLSATDTVEGVFEVNQLADLDLPNSFVTEGRAIADQVIKQLVLNQLTNIADGTQHFSVQIYPEELGRLEIVVTGSQDQMMASIIASKSLASELLVREKPYLVAALNEQGVNLPDVSISHRSPNEQQSPGRRYEMYEPREPQPLPASKSFQVTTSYQPQSTSQRVNILA
jgi:hypothetical protein